MIDIEYKTKKFIDSPSKIKSKYIITVKFIDK